MLVKLFYFLVLRFVFTRPPRVGFLRHLPARLQAGFVLQELQAIIFSYHFLHDQYRAVSLLGGLVSHL